MRKFIKNLASIEMLPTYGLIFLMIAIWAIIAYADKNGYLDPVKTENRIHPSEVR